MTRAMLNALAVLLLTAGMAQGVLWHRSYRVADRVHGKGSGRDSYIVASKQGYVTIFRFRSHAHPDWWQWGVHHDTVDDVMAFPAGPMPQYVNSVGFGSIQNPIYYVMRPTYTTPTGMTVHLYGAATASLNGSGVIMPFWFTLLICFGLSAALGLWAYHPSERKREAVGG